MTSLQKGDVVTLKEMMYCDQPLKVSKVYEEDSDESYVLLRTSYKSNLRVPRCYIDKRIGNVHDWFGFCGRCHNLSKGGRHCWKCDVVVEPNCITWTGMKVHPRFLQRGAIDPLMYTHDCDRFDDHPIAHDYVNPHSRSEFEDLHWLKPCYWQAQYFRFWMQEIVLVLQVVGATELTLDMIEMINVGMASCGLTFHTVEFSVGRLHEHPQLFDFRENDEISVGMSCSSNDDVRNFHRHQCQNDDRTYNYSEEGPDSIYDWYREIGWIFGVLGAKKMTPVIVEMFNNKILNVYGK
jgi:hypothetical protein